MDIDCLIIGHNEMNFVEYEKTLRQMGVNSGAYRDLQMNFIWYNNRPYDAAGIYNALSGSEVEASRVIEPLTIGENFSAAISYLGTFLQRRGFTVDFINAFQQQKQELAEKLTAHRILAVAIPTTLYVSAFPIIEIIEFVRTCNPTVKIIVGGPFILTQVRSQDPAALKYLFKTSLGADFYVSSSQGEAALVKILHALKQGLSFHHINNIFYRTGEHADAKYVSTPVQRERSPLTENMVDWRLFADKVGKYVNVRTAISCPFSCSFCGFPQRAGKYQTADVPAIEKELRELAKIETLKCVHFIDDTLAYLKGIQQLKSCGIVTFGNFIIGFPGETRETVQDTVEFIEKSGLDFYRVQLWYSEPITPIRQEKDKYKLEGDSFAWRHRTMDSGEACDLIEEIFQGQRQPIWVPQYNFDFDTFWHLVHRGMSVNRAGDFLRSFNNAVREKLTAAAARPREISYEKMKQLKDACMGNHGLRKKDKTLRFEVEFDF